MQLCVCHHHMFLTSSIITELDSVFNVSKKSRRKCIFDQHLSWHAFAQQHSVHPEFHRHLCMSFRLFEKLVGLLKESLAVHEDMVALWGGAILPELCVYVTLWYLAGGSYTDIFYLVGISQPSFYHVLWKTIKAINSCTELWISWPNTKERQLECATGFTPISTNRALRDCVAV